MNSTNTTAAINATANTAINGYVNHWIKIRQLSGEFVALALQGSREAWSFHHNREVLIKLTMPSSFEEAAAAMTAVQFRTAKKIASAFGHLWTWFDSAYDWADHFNEGREDGYNSSYHPLPTPADATASGRYCWDVDRRGGITFEVNRPQGTACRVTGTLTNFVIEITKIALDRHLVCLFQQLQSVFGLSPDDAIERIETARGFNLMGIRGGELHKVVLA